MRMRLKSRNSNAYAIGFSPGSRVVRAVSAIPLHSPAMGNGWSESPAHLRVELTLMGDPSWRACRMTHPGIALLVRDLEVTCYAFEEWRGVDTELVALCQNDFCGTVCLGGGWEMIRREKATPEEAFWGTTFHRIFEAQYHKRLGETLGQYALKMNIELTEDC